MSTSLKRAGMKIRHRLGENLLSCLCVCLLTASISFALELARLTSTCTCCCSLHDRRYQHRWTFARSFHVSPFNSRDGYYTLSLNAPFTTSATLIPTCDHIESSNHPSLSSPLSAKLSISLLLLTPEKTPKLHARLASTPSVSPLPFTSHQILYQTLCVFPIALIMTTPRIMWNAGVLAWGKKLRMYARPEPVSMVRPDPGEVEAKAPLSDWGLVQTSPVACPGGIHSRPISSAELFSRELVLKFIKHRLDALKSSTSKSPTSPLCLVQRVEIISSHSSIPPTVLSNSRDGSVNTDALKALSHSATSTTLILTLYSPLAFTLLLLSPNASHALQTLARPFPHTVFHASNETLFRQLFSIDPSDSVRCSSTYEVIFTHLVRAYNPLSPQPVRALSRPVKRARHWIDPILVSSSSVSRPLDHTPGKLGWMLGRTLVRIVLSEYAEGWVIGRLGVHFVEGGEGWRGIWRESTLG